MQRPSQKLVSAPITICTNSVIKYCNFVHYFFGDGGYLDFDHVPNTLKSPFIFFERFPPVSVFSPIIIELKFYRQ